MTDPQEALRNFKPSRSFFVGIDSDGCAFDTMELKHKECFIPNTIKYYGLQAVSKYAREVAEFVNLYSEWRGINRFPSLTMTIDMLKERPEVRRRGVKMRSTEALQRFIDSGNVNSDSEILNAGYNYAITRKDTIGLVYLFSAYRYPGNPQAIGDHVGQFVYGRKITGRLALRLAVGPEVTTFRVPIGGSTQKIGGAGNAALTYAFARSGVRLSYIHGVSEGSGVFTGSNIDEAIATWSRQLTRAWNGSLSFGYAKNRQILSVSGLASPSYNTWLAGAGLSRALGRAADFSVAYEAQIQNSNVAICSTPNCGTNYTTHQVFLTFKWHTRPLVLK